MVSLSDDCIGQHELVTGLGEVVGCIKNIWVIRGKRLSVQETYEARDGFTELQGWIYAFS